MDQQKVIRYDAISCVAARCIALCLMLPYQSDTRRNGAAHGYMQAGYAQIEAAKKHPCKATMEKAAAAMGITLEQLAY